MRGSRELAAEQEKDVSPASAALHRGLALDSPAWSGKASRMLCATTGAPDSVLALLEEFRGARWCPVDFPGNHGDALLDRALHALAHRAGLDLCPTASEADVYVQRGGGGKRTVEQWSSSSAMRNLSLRRTPERFLMKPPPDKPLVVLPSSFDGTPAFFAHYRGRTARTVLFAREPASLSRLRSLDLATAEIRIDHDTALALRDDSLLEPLRQSCDERYILLADRFDWERQPFGSPLRPGGTGVLSFFFRRLPRPLRRRFCRKALRTPLSTAFAKAAKTWAVAETPGVGRLPVVHTDPSERFWWSFPNFLDLVAKAAVVVSLRLHVGLLAAMLGKRVLLVDGAPEYGKVSGVAGFSLAGQDTVSVMPLAELFSETNIVNTKTG